MSNLRLAIPSTGALYEETIKLLEKKNLKINRVNSRKYTADIPSLNKVNVLFQRQSDITIELDNDSADVGIVGLDRFYEFRFYGFHSTGLCALISIDFYALHSVELDRLISLKYSGLNSIKFYGLDSIEVYWLVFEEV